jgi:hypothetical protein
VSLANGHTLHFWYIPQADAERAPTVLYLHGARWNLNGSVFRMSRWVDLGFNVLAVDYRGWSTESAVGPAYEDARATTAERRRHRSARRFIYGHSSAGRSPVDLTAGPLKEQETNRHRHPATASIHHVRETKWGWVPASAGGDTDFRFRGKDRPGRFAAADHPRHRRQHRPAYDGR